MDSESTSATNENEDNLSDFDIHRLVEALQSRQAKSFVSCALSIKVILAEVQHQLLNLMDTSEEIDLASYPVDFPSDDDDPHDTDFQVPGINAKTVVTQVSQLS